MPYAHFILGVKRQLLYLHPVVRVSDGVISVSLPLFLHLNHAALFGTKVVMKERCPETNQVIMAVRVIKVESIPHIFHTGAVNRLVKFVSITGTLFSGGFIFVSEVYPVLVRKRDIRSVAAIHQCSVGKELWCDGVRPTH